MKKFLLFAIVAVLALGVNAEQRAAKFQRIPAELQLTSVKKSNIMRMQTPIQFAGTDLRKIEGTRMHKQFQATAPSKGMHKAPAQTDIYGDWIEDYTDEADGVNQLTCCGGVTLREYIDEETQAPYVELDGLCGGWADVLAEYDPEEGTLTIPQQYCWDHEEYGLFIISGVTEWLETGGAKLGELVLRVYEDEYGMYIAIDEEVSKGWAVIMTEGEYAQSAWTMGEDLALNPANYYGAYLRLDADEKGNWAEKPEEATEPLYVEMSAHGIVYHGFMGMSTLQIDLDEEGYATYANAQPMVYYGPQNGFFRMRGFAMEDGKLLPEETEYHYPVLFTETGDMYLADLPEDPDAKDLDWEAWVIMNSEGYWTGSQFACYIAYTRENAETNGVNTVLAPTADTESSLYTVDGKLATGLKSGLMLRGGKKFIVR